ncbi:putative membrane protein [Mycobacterium xenopi 3993]|nr:putative membrane protein [Mycobacterium xenopi 3993]
MGLHLGGLGAGIVGAVLGTLGGYTARTRLVGATGGHDLPVALVEDAVAVLGGFAVAAMTGIL